jgi:hypothetical protein
MVLAKEVAPEVRLVAHSAALIPAGPRDVRIVSGLQTLKFHWIGKGLATAIGDEFSVTVNGTNGAEHLQDLCVNLADVGLTHAHLVLPCAGITAIANIFRSTLHIVARFRFPIPWAWRLDVGQAGRRGSRGDRGIR